MAKSERKRRVSLWLDEDAFDLLNELTTVHRRGRYLSELIRRAAAASEAPPPDTLLQRIEERLERIEAKLEAREEREPARGEQPEDPQQGSHP